jgi:hypothetical protein
MTAPRTSSDFVPAVADASEDVSVKPVTFPGRWVGGAVGIAATAVVGAALFAVDVATAEDLAPAWFICVLGIPIAFVLGRQLAPIAGGGGWGSAAWAALSFGLLAPPLGNLEIVAGALMLPGGWNQQPTYAVAVAMLVLIAGMAVCFVAAPMTLAVGFLWVVLMRLIPPDRVARLRMPPSIERLGVRHAAVLIGICLIGVLLARGIAGPSSGW